MKKLLITGLVVTGLMVAGPAAVMADSHSDCKKCASKSSYSKCDAKQEKCKVSKLKNKTKLLWENQEKLGLKDDQLDKIKDIKLAAIKELIQLKADKEIVKVDLKALWYDDVVDVEKANQLIEAKYAAKEGAAKVFVKAISDIQSELTKEQRDKWKELCKKSKKGSCAKCSGAKFCPLTGKPLDKK